MIRGALVACLCTGCWRGEPPPASAPPPTASPAQARHYPWASIEAIRECTAAGPTALVVRIAPDAGAGQLEAQIAFDPAEAAPLRVPEGEELAISICAFHGCTDSWMALDTLEIGKRARGRYRIEANAGPTYEGTFDASWIGAPWQVRPCPYDMNPP